MKKIIKVSGMILLLLVAGVTILGFTNIIPFETILTAIIVVLLAATLLTVYLIYRVLLKAKFHSAVVLSVVFMIDRLLRGLGRLYTSTVDTPPLLDNPKNEWVRVIVTSNITYTIVSLALFLCILWVLYDINTKFRYATTKEIKRVGNKETFVAEKVIPDDVQDRPITILKEIEHHE